MAKSPRWSRELLNVTARVGEARWPRTSSTLLCATQVETTPRTPRTPRLQPSSPFSAKFYGDKRLSASIAEATQTSLRFIRGSARCSVDFHPVSLTTYIEYDPMRMSLREYVHRVASFQETHHLRFRHKYRLPRRSAAFVSGIQLFRDLQLLETMFRPGNVVAPSPSLAPTLRKLHRVLAGIKVNVEQDFQQIQRLQRELTASEFIEWVYESFTVSGKKMKAGKRFLRNSTDSLHGGKRDIETAIGYYSTAEALSDKSMTGVMAECIVNALQCYLTAHLATRKTLFQRVCSGFQKAMGNARESEATAGGSFKVTEPQDRLVYAFPVP